MTSRRRIVLDALDRWVAEGRIDEATYLRLRSATEDEKDAALDEALAHSPADTGGRGGFAMVALQLVGGLLLGAALIAFVVFLGLRDATAAWAMLLFGILPLGVGVGLHLLARGGDERLQARDGLIEALFAAGLVPIAGSPTAIDTGVPQLKLVGLLAAAICAASYLLRRGRGPSALLAGGGYSFAILATLMPGLFGSANAADAYLLWGLLLAFGGVLLYFRHEAWTSFGLGLYVGPLCLAFFIVVHEVWQLEGDLALQGAFAVYLGLLLGVGILLGDRGLVAGSAAGLTIDAVAFAFELGGAGTAVVFLLILGGLLVWQAEFLRNYFRRRAA
ncbi:MAG TPA: hypothetical protein VHH36_02285 [Candidatus Thermoplasmatota archaeon]|nr:hypothetical protein [Candidatus Thermoplasmatota archaeon]